MDKWMPIRRAVAEQRLGYVRAESLPAFAVDALLAGLDSPMLRQLATMEGATWSEIEAALERLLEETGGPLTEHETKVLAADSWLQQVAEDRWWYRMQDLLEELGGEYEWFRQTLCEIDALRAQDQPVAVEAKLAEMRAQAERVLRER